jgi:hypothetical protein
VRALPPQVAGEQALVDEAGQGSLVSYTSWKAACHAAASDTRVTAGGSCATRTATRSGVVGHRLALG